MDVGTPRQEVAAAQAMPADVPLQSRLIACCPLAERFAQAEQYDAEFRARHGYAPRADIQTLREIVARDGFSGLREYVARHGAKGLPAIGALGLLSDELSPDRPEGF